MFTIRDCKARKSVTLEKHEVKQILTAAALYNLDELKGREAKTFGETVKGYDLDQKGMVEMCLQNQYDTWVFLKERDKAIRDIEHKLFGE